MTRMEMVAMLKAHTTDDAGEKDMLLRTIEFAEAHPDCCERALSIGHMTGSAWVVDSDRTHALMTHHRKLNRWLQMGGHADGNPNLREVAMREAREESGLAGLRILSETPFDVDVHLIPARGAEAAHFHYDVRFLLEGDRMEALVVSEESHALSWLPLGDLLESGESIARMVRKTQATVFQA